jgi:hypothetical protein
MSDPNHPVQRVPFKQEGWGAAAFVVFLAIVAASGAFYVHKKTYKQPTDVRFHASGTETPTHQ